MRSSEFAADFPVAGGAFNYISLTFGEFAAWAAACDLILEYTLSAAAVAKGFTAYLASLIQVGYSLVLISEARHKMINPFTRSI